MKRHREDEKTKASLVRDQGSELKQHAAVLNNIGAHLIGFGEMLNAMRVLQQSVQILMLTESGTEEGMPSTEQIELSRNWLLRLSGNETKGSPDRKVPRATGAPTSQEQQASGPSEENRLNNCKHCGIPGLFGSLSKIRNALSSSERPILTFTEPFFVDLEDDDLKLLRIRNSKSTFRCPSHQCSKATLFNMGLIHYIWNSNDTAVQFFELSKSLSGSLPLITQDLVVLACLNNIGQIRLHTNRTSEAMSLFSDALNRGNTALAAFYPDDVCSIASSQEHYERARARRRRPSSAPSTEASSSPSSSSARTHTSPLHIVLARTLLNIGQVHFNECNFEASERTWLDAVRLVHPHTPPLEAAAFAYNMALIHHHQNHRLKAIEYLDQFLERATAIVGTVHLQIATALHRKGLIYLEMGDLYRSMKPLLETFQIRNHLLGPEHALVAETLFSIARVFQEREEYDRASKALDDCLTIRQSLCHDRDGSLEVAQTLMEVGRTHHSQGRRQESVDAYLNALRLTRRFFGHRHKYVARILNIVGNLHLELGRVKDAMSYFLDAMRIHVEQGLPIDFGVVQNALYRVDLQPYPGAGGA